MFEIVLFFFPFRSFCPIIFFDSQSRFRIFQGQGGSVPSESRAFHLRTESYMPTWLKIQQAAGLSWVKHSPKKVQRCVENGCSCVFVIASFYSNSNSILQLCNVPIFMARKKNGLRQGLNIGPPSSRDPWTESEISFGLNLQNIWA